MATKKHVVAGDQVVGVQHPIEVVAGGQRLLALRLVARPQLRLDRAAHALERAGGDDALGRTADAHQHVHVGAVPGGADRAGDVAVADERIRAPAAAYLVDQLGVPGPVQDADGDVGDAGPLGLGDAAQILGDARVDVDHVGAVRADRDLLHVEDGARVEHRAAFGHRQHRHRIRACPCSSASCRRSGRPRRPPRARVPSPTSSPLNSIGALSFSPSPITTTPRIWIELISLRMASTAAPSPPFLSPRPTQRPAAIAAASVTRTRSRAMLRSRSCGTRAGMRPPRERCGLVHRSSHGTMGT